MPTCKQCTRALPASNFNKTSGGKRALVNGGVRQHEYRDDVCRRCRRENNLRDGKCNCSRPLAADKKACEVCLEACRRATAERCRLDRIAAISHYGNGCAYCGENLFVFLTIDHVNNDGAKHRQHVRRNSRIQTGFNIGAWLRRNKYPEGFQVLCVNCNHAKSRVGEEQLIAILREAGRLRAGFKIQPVLATEYLQER